MPEHKDSWSEGGQVFFTGGHGWGCAPDGRTICMGTEEEINKAWQNNSSLGNALLDNILRMDINYRGIQKTSSQGIARRHRTQNKRVRR